MITFEINLIFFFLINILVCSFMISTSFQPITATLALAFAFINASLIFLIMGFEFISLIFLIVYVGAIIILFLFSVLLLNLKHERALQKSSDINYKVVVILFLCNYMLYFFMVLSENSFIEDSFYISDKSSLYTLESHHQVMDYINTCVNKAAGRTLTNFGVFLQSDLFLPQYVPFFDFSSPKFVYSFKNITSSLDQLPLCFFSISSFSFKFISFIDYADHIANPYLVCAFKNHIGIHSILFLDILKDWDFLYLPSIQLTGRIYNYDLLLNSELESLGLVLYTNGCLYLISVSVLLLVALVGSVVLISTDNKSVVEYQNITSQISKKYKR
jgi:NADH:ubiquinone oxidoreductase subunit 6 (subunit J)